MFLEALPQGKELLLGAGLSSLPEFVADLLGGVPAVQVHLVPAHVEHVRVEEFEEVLVELAQGGVHMRVDRVELTARWFHTIILHKNFWVTTYPNLR